MYVLDTDHLVVLQQPATDDREHLENRLEDAGRPNIYLSIVSFHEQALGAHKYLARARGFAAVVKGYMLFERVLKDFATRNVLSFDEPAALEFDRLRRARVRIGTMDLRIAAIALSRNFTVLTRNAVDFAAVPGLRVEDWTIE
jgi:tRNA(fMet)-specific endonuclease VapC